MADFWNIKKHSNPDREDPRAADAGLGRYYIRATDALGNKGFVIGFKHVPTQKRVQFKAFITSFNETYKSDWNTETVFGRPDPIHMFKNTERTIALGWNIPAASVSEGYDNLFRLQQFLQFLYPTYSNVNAAQTINQSPLVRLELMNMVRSYTDPDGDGWDAYRTPGEFKRKSSAPRPWADNATPAINGLLGVIGSVSIAHNLDKPDIGVFERGIGAPGEGTSARILPRMIEVQIDFSVIHEHPLGWENGEFAGGGAGSHFPYGLNGEPTSGDGTVNGTSATDASEGQTPEVEEPDSAVDDQVLDEEPVEEADDDAAAETGAGAGAGEQNDATVTRDVVSATCGQECYAAGTAARKEIGAAGRHEGESMQEFSLRMRSAALAARVAWVRAQAEGE